MSDIKKEIPSYLLIELYQIAKEKNITVEEVIINILKMAYNRNVFDNYSESSLTDCD